MAVKAGIAHEVGRCSERILLHPSGEALKAGVRFIEAFRSAQPAGTGLRKGLYRYHTHEEMNRADDERIAQALAKTITATK